ncbi:hypothetical protein IAR55_000723 [Kwoniella newhampshirensis]|uniref:ubiquitinyl hydrolase 1 n=1 Tax=Kwoniella newhampshirensis TaxID=1651941 RepID=A0AAW0Z3S7_9TREE
MSISEVTFNALKDMGIEPVLAREAASRYHSVEPAVNWCFGDGANWQPEVPQPEAMPIQHAWRPQATQGTSVEHREVLDADDDSTLSSYPPTPSTQPPPPKTTTLGSNNPFRQDVTAAPPPPYPARPLQGQSSLTPTLIDDDDEDEELRKAIALSQAESVPSSSVLPVPVPDPTAEVTVTAVEDDGMRWDITDFDENEKRQERERSVRATGVPPPSPEGEVNDEGEVMQTLFGPSEKNDVEGKMALVPAGQNNSLSKEDADMNRAIQESLMTASFHSASAIRDADKPVPVKRQEGAPVALFSQSGQSSYATNLVQAMCAVPQLREAVHTALAQGNSLSRKGEVIAGLFKEVEEDPLSFVEVDEPLKDLRDGYERYQLPPNEPAREFHSTFEKEILDICTGDIGSYEVSESDLERFRAPYRRLFNTLIQRDPPHPPATHVNFRRRAGLPNDVYSHLAEILWGADAPNQSINELSDVLTVMLGWTPGSAREIWQLEETVVLDRFMTSNAAYAAQKRAMQSVSAGNVRRTQEKIDQLSLHNGHNFQDSIATLIEHFETSPPSDDAMQAESRREMKEKLEQTLKVLKAKVAELKMELEEENKAATGSVFETDDPALKQHVYTLRAVLFHDGALVGANHLYMYVKGDDGRWWKMQEHEVTQVEWETIASDKTGLWMDGGPYVLVYSREGLRPVSPAESPVAQTAVAETESEGAKIVSEGDLIDVTMDETRAPIDLLTGTEETMGAANEVKRKSLDVSGDSGSGEVVKQDNDEPMLL